MGEPTCTFTGHRAEKLPWGYNENDPRCRRLKRTLYDTLEAVYESGFHRFICGMAEGCDFYFCEAVLALREDHPDTVTVLQEHYSPGCMMKRNRYMVDHADLIIACYDGKSGGTLNTLRYAIEREIQIVHLPPENV